MFYCLFSSFDFHVGLSGTQYGDVTSAAFGNFVALILKISKFKLRDCKNFSFAFRRNSENSKIF